MSIEQQLCEEYRWSIRDVENMELYSVLFYLRRIREKQEYRAKKEIAQMKLLIVAIHSDPEKLLQSIEETESYAEADYDSEIGDLAKIEKYRRRGSNGE